MHLDLVKTGKTGGQYRYLLTVIDVLTRFLITVPLENKILETTARAFVDYVVYRWGCSVNIITGGELNS